jgi:hypothetical protein
MPGLFLVQKRNCDRDALSLNSLQHPPEGFLAFVFFSVVHSFFAYITHYSLLRHACRDRLRELP